ncbi:MAG: hypothetical protein EOO38_01295 [Cytophagaceae bacterium]|nr:MAG: hypothetical protein EOO38_01295 [Cytophagaceae bacterium]
MSRFRGYYWRNKMIMNFDVTFGQKLTSIFDDHVNTRVNGKQASTRTVQAMTEGLRGNFRLLRGELGFKLQDPVNLREVHIQALCAEWYRQGLSPKTMQGYLSHIRIFCGWIGKGGMVKTLRAYLPNVPAAELRVSTVATKSKSWAEAGIDVQEKIADALALDWRFGYMLMSQVAFGLRAHEAIQFKPWKYERDGRLSFDKTKGGRPRDVFIDTDAQRAILELIKSKLKKNETLGWTHRPNGQLADLKYSKARYYRLMRKLGITKEQADVVGHGLRAQFAENSALLLDFIPATLGGTPGQKDRGQIEVDLLKTSESLGHSRPSITNAYYGSLGRQTKLDGPGRAKSIISECCASITVEQLKAIIQERIDDCVILGKELLQIEVAEDPRKVQFLWEHHSNRNAVNWIKPATGSNLAAIEAAAISILRRDPPAPEAVA